VKRLLSLAAVATIIAVVWPAQDAFSTTPLPGKRAKRPAQELVIHQMIVKLRNPKAVELVAPLGAERVAALSKRAGVKMTGFRAMSGGASVLRLAAPLRLNEARAAAARLAADPEVEYAEPDLPVRAYQTVPPDAGYLLRHWHYFGPGEPFVDRGLNLAGNKQVTAVGGANLPGAWSTTQGAASIVVAVVDSGVALTHPEVAAAVLPGYDFVSGNVAPFPANFVANDGDGRDADATDPGDWVTATEKTNFPDCDDGQTGDTDSSWHGTHMAATIVGTWGNGVGPNPAPGTSVAGIAPIARLLPVRALGKCGGQSSDVADAIVWAAGLPVPNVPNNPNPAQIINLSLGSQGGGCSTTYSNAINAVFSRALVIAAAGNDGTLGVSQPANCAGVLAVTAHTIDGDNADYANVGPEVGLSSPGGGAPTQIVSNIGPNDIGYYTWSAVLFGRTTPTSTDGGNPPRSGPAVGGFTGTSSATAHVSGVAALVLSMRPSLAPSDLRSVLVSNTRPHPAGTFCAQGQLGAGQCGSGLLDAGRAVAAVAPPPSGGGGGGAVALAPLLALGLFALAARRRRG
jgi:serine protease